MGALHSDQQKGCHEKVYDEMIMLDFNSPVPASVAVLRSCSLQVVDAFTVTADTLDCKRHHERASSTGKTFELACAKHYATVG